MFPTDPYSLGVILIAIGLAFYGLVWLLLRAAPRVQKKAIPAQAVELSAQSEAALVLAPGGRVLALNDKAREVFRLEPEEKPSLDVLVRRVRDSREFLSLCAGEGSVRFALDGRAMEGAAYRVPANPEPLTLVTLRPAGELIPLSAGANGNGAALQAFSAISLAMAASLELEPTLQAILENIDRLLPADRIEICVWEPEHHWLVPYRLEELESGERGLRRAPDPYPVDRGYPGHLFEHREPLLISSDDGSPAVEAAGEAAGSIRSYMGLPLLAGREFVGTLELGSHRPGAFQDEDLQRMEMAAGQAAVALHNAQLYRAEQRRAAELSGLAQLAEAFGSLRDPKDLFARLVQSIAPLVDVEVLGFLIYNESQRTLEGQVPFQGVPAPFVTEAYRTRIVPGSPAEEILLAQDVLLTPNAAEDEQWGQLEMTHLAHAASLRETALVPLSSGGRMLGYLQASNHRDGRAAFTQGELHLLTIIANQAAPIIENAWLVRQSRQRAQRAEALRRIASLASSAATLDEILDYSLHELAHLLRSDAAAIFLLDEGRGELRLHQRSIFGLKGEASEPIARVYIEDPQFHFTVAGGLHALVSADALIDEGLLPLYRPMVERLGVRSLIVVPLVVRDRGIGELWLGSREPDFFDNSDLQVVSTAAGQLAGVVEGSQLAVQTDESLRRRVAQLTALTRISRELSSTLDLKYLLQTIYDEAVRTTGADCGAILLFDPEGMEGEATSVLISVGHELPERLTRSELDAIQQAGPLRIDDLNSSAYAPAHVRVLSELIVPVLFHGRVAGLIHLHAAAAHHFDDTAVEITEALAVQAALVLGNALQYQEQLRRGEMLARRVETLARLRETAEELRLGHPLDKALDGIAAVIQEATPFQAVLISLLPPGARTLRRVAARGIAPADWEALRAREQPYDAVRELFQPEFRVSRSYFLPADRRPAIPAEVHAVAVLPPAQGAQEADAWDPEDVLLVPLYGRDEAFLGMISLDAPRDGRRPDQITIEALESFAVHAGLAVANARRLEEIEGSLSARTSELESMQVQLGEAQELLPSLERKGADQVQALRRLGEQARRLRDAMEIADLANRQTDAHGVLTVLAREIMARNGLDLALVAEDAPSGPRLLEVIGAPPAQANPEALFGQRNPLRQSFQGGEVRLVAAVSPDDEAQASPLLAALGARSFICLPIRVGERVAASMLAIGSRELPEFTPEDVQAYTQLAHQCAMMLENLNLLAETRQHLREVNLLLEFSRQLGSLDAASILTALVESSLRVIPAAQAGLVALWDAGAARLVPQAAQGYADVASLLTIRYARGEALPGRVFASGQPARVGEIDFARDYSLPAEDLLAYHRATGDRLPLSSLLVPIRSGEVDLGLLLLDCFATPAAFSEEDEALAGSLAQQTALALENARLFQASEERAGQLQALNSAAGSLSASLQRGELIAGLLGQLRTIVPYDTGIIWLRRGSELSVAAADGFPDSEQRLGLTAAVDDSALFKQMLVSGEILSVGDVRQDERFLALAEVERLAWLGIPLVAKKELIGLIALEKNEAGFYTLEHQRAAATFASQAAVALENARLYEESLRRAAEMDRRAQRLALLNRLSGELGGSLDLDHILRITARELLQALNASSVAAILFEDGAPVLHADEPGGRSLPERIPHAPLFDRLRQTLGIFASYDVTVEPDLAPLAGFFEARGACSLLTLPLATGTDLHGVLFLQTASPYRFSPAEIELARTIANQTAIASQNARLFAETRRLTEELEQRVRERTAELRAEHQNTQTLLRIITELSASLDIGQVLNRTLAVLNDATGAGSSAILMAQPDGLRVEYRSGAAEGEAEAAELALGAASIRQRQPLALADLPAEELMPAAAGALHDLLGVPLVMGEEVLGALVLSIAAPGGFARQQLSLVEAAARQIGVALNNASLFNLIRDQAEHMGSMLREQQVEASRSRAILEAVADGVLVTDASGRITLFNASAGRILNLDAQQVLGQPLESFMGLFGKAGVSWSEAIREWSQDSPRERGDETYAERINLEGGRVVAVHLAPVYLRSELLGTVSIFRDVTHEVQVDRLKSEFVANVSHELRTPITSIKGYVEVILMGAAGQVNDQQRQFLDIVRNNTERLTVLVNDLLDVSRIEAGRMRLTMQPIDLHEVARETAEMIQRRAQEEQKPMALALELPAGLPAVTGDRERVQQMFDNLVDNAYNYTPVDGHIILRVHPLGDEVQVDVIDDGVGIPPEDQPRIFERFFRGDDPLVLATAGTGLGLSIVKTLVEMHHGRLWFESRGVPGAGSVFSFTLPLHHE